MKTGQTLVSAALLLLLTSCATDSTHKQREFHDDAGRRVMLPATVSRVFAAGAPAEMLLYTLAPEQMVGRNHMPSATALPFMPGRFRNPTPIRALPDADDAGNDGDLLALEPDVYIDYGDLDADYIAGVDAVQRRTGIPALILDGRLERIATTYRRLGTALGVTPRGERLARETERILQRYRGSLARNGRPLRLYMACGGIQMPCLSDTLTGEVGDLLGAGNVAGNEQSSLRRPITAEDLQRWQPEVIVMQNRSAAERLLADPAWQSVPAIRERRVYGPHDVPFSWGTRPPSVNRLLNLIWLTHVAGTRSESFEADVRRFFRVFYQVDLSDDQWRQLQQPLQQ